MQFKNFEAWVWTELLAFDNSEADCGVRSYLEELGFVPQAMCLLVSSPDFILNYAGMDEEYELPPDVCARNGQKCNERRERQVWTNYQLSRLIATLTHAGCQVYCSAFTVFLDNRFHHEWLSDHPEVRLVWASCWRGQELNPLAEMADGTLFEDYFVPKMVQVCQDYGFAGWHGPDGWGPWSSGNITSLDFSDATVKQFLRGHSWNVPECFEPIPRIVTQLEIQTAEKQCVTPPDYGMAQLRARRDWIVENHFSEWREFLAERWAQFWGKALNALHAVGLKGVINSAWTKGNFDAFFEYGINYRRMAEIGVDAMVVETVALGMSQSSPNIDWYHDSYAAALAEIKAACPGLKLIMLHGIKDVEEFWDNLRLAPASYERELYKLSNMFVRHASGTLERAAAGLLGCLADGIDADDWKTIRTRWNACFEEIPVRAGALTAVYFDEYIEQGVGDYQSDGFIPALDQISTLMQSGVPVQSFVNLKNVSVESGALLVPSAHLLSSAQRFELLNRPSPVVFAGRAAVLEGLEGYVLTDGSFALVIANAGLSGIERFEELPAPQANPGYDEIYFSIRRYRKPVSPELWQKAAQIIAGLLPDASIASTNMPVSLLFKEFADGTREIAVESRAQWGRAKTTVTAKGLPAPTKIVSSFPPRVMEQDDVSFTIPVPCRGITAVKIEKQK